MAMERMFDAVRCGALFPSLGRFLSGNVLRHLPETLFHRNTALLDL